MSIEQNKANMRRGVEEVWNKGNLAVIDELFAPKFVPHGLPPGYKADLAGYKEYVKAVRAAFPDLHFVIEELIAEVDKVVGRFTWTGTNSGPLVGIPNVPATFKKVTSTGIVIVRCDETGKALELWSEMDQVAELQQLGIMPTPA